MGKNQTDNGPGADEQEDTPKEFIFDWLRFDEERRRFREKSVEDIMTILRYWTSLWAVNAPGKEMDVRIRMDFPTYQLLLIMGARFEISHGNLVAHSLHRALSMELSETDNFLHHVVSSNEELSERIEFLDGRAAEIERLMEEVEWVFEGLEDRG